MMKVFLFLKKKQKSRTPLQKENPQTDHIDLATQSNTVIILAGKSISIHKNQTLYDYIFHKTNISSKVLKFNHNLGFIFVRMVKYPVINYQKGKYPVIKSRNSNIPSKKKKQECNKITIKNCHTYIVKIKCVQCKCSYL